MQKFELVIAGGGLVAARAIKSYRESAGGGRIALLSKRQLQPPEIAVAPDGFARRHATVLT